MDGKIVIEFEGKDYEVKPPTLKTWSKLNLYKDLEQEEDFVLTLVSISTGIDEENLKLVNYLKVKSAADYLSEYFITLGNKFYPTFEFKGVEYKFIDINNLSFGQFVDIDTFLTKDESYKKINMNELIAMLYEPVDQEKYDASLIPERKKLFEDLDVKYLQGSLLFFLTLRRRLQETTPYFSILKWKSKRKIKKMLKPFLSIGAGMQRLYSWLVKTLRISKK